jgi:hypothetical protein
MRVPGSGSRVNPVALVTAGVAVAVAVAAAVGDGLVVSVGGTGVFVGGSGVRVGSRAIWGAVAARDVGVGSAVPQPATRSDMSRTRANVP